MKSWKRYSQVSHWHTSMPTFNFLIRKMPLQSSQKMTELQKKAQKRQQFGMTEFDSIVYFCIHWWVFIQSFWKCTLLITIDDCLIMRNLNVFRDWVWEIWPLKVRPIFFGPPDMLRVLDNSNKKNFIMIPQLDRTS